jgi:protein-L-isoaspartate(D-aspartate) O-methyltransferase
MAGQESLHWPKPGTTIRPKYRWNRRQAGSLSGMPDPAEIVFLPQSENVRRRMVERQLIRRGIADKRVLEAMGTVPREVFVPLYVSRRAYDDCALPIEAHQTISQPYIVALTAEAAELKATDRILEIGTGSGYAAAVFAQIAAHVYTIERHGLLAETAAARLEALGYGNIDVRTGDGMLGWPEAAPFDAILAAASGTRIPETWKQQLTVGGRLVMPRGATGAIQKLIKLTRTGENDFSEESLGEVMFVPLVGGEDQA